jgi:hypothetical protein
MAREDVEDAQLLDRHAGRPQPFLQFIFQLPIDAGDHITQPIIDFRVTRAFPPPPAVHRTAMFTLHQFAMPLLWKGTGLTVLAEGRAASRRPKDRQGSVNRAPESCRCRKRPFPETRASCWRLCAWTGSRPCAPIG